MKDFKSKFYVLNMLIILLTFSITRNQAPPVTDFTIFPEDAESAGVKSILSGMSSDEKVLGAVQFGSATSSDAAGDIRDNLTFTRIANCVSPVKYLDGGVSKTATSGEYDLSVVDKTADTAFQAKTSHWQYLKYLLKGTGSKYTGFICNFDVTGALLSGDNEYKLHLITAQKGAGPKLSFCVIPPDTPGTPEVPFKAAVPEVPAVKDGDGNIITPAVPAVPEVPYQPAGSPTPSPANDCTYWTNYTKDATDFKTTSDGVDLNVITIKKNATDGTTVDVKINEGSWQSKLTTKNSKVYFRLEKGTTTELYIGPAVATVKQTNANAADNNKKYMVQPGTCNSDNLRCITGKYCTGASDKCSGTCDPSCLTCTGSNNNNCTQCSPFFEKGYLGPSTGKCGGLDVLPINKLSSDKTVTLASNNLYSHAGTLSFWALVEDNTAFGEKTFTVSHKNRIKIWVGSKTAKKVGVWCIPRPNFYQNIKDGSTYSLEDISTKTQLETQVKDTEKTILFKEMDEKKDGLWFHVKCAYSITKPHAYLQLHQKDGTLKKEAKEMKTHNYLKTKMVDFPFRDFSSNNQIVISNGGVTSKNIFLKGITAFIDYLPDAALYEYFRISKAANPLLSSLVFFAEVNDNAVSGTDMTLKYLDCNPNSNTCATNTSTVSLSDVNLSLIPSYIRLNLLTQTNKFYSKKDLLTTGSLTCPTNTWCYKNNKAFACPDKKYLKADSTCVVKCASPANPHYLPNLNSSYSGNCTSKCGTSRKCTDDSLLNDYSTFACKDNTFTKSYLYCFANADDDKGAMHFGSMFSPPDIKIPVSPAMDNYHIEIWYFPDPRYIAKSDLNGWNFFETNSFACKKNVISNTVVNDYACYKGASKIGGDVTMKFMNWNRLAFSVTGSGSSYNFSFHFNKYNGATASQTVNSSLSLNQIRFCIAGCSNQRWASGFYKWLKVYDAKFMPTTLFKKKDIFFDYSDIYKVPVFNNIQRFYPMTLKYLAGKVKEYTNNSNDVTVSTGLTGDNFRAINFSKNFFTETDNKFTTSLDIADAKLGQIEAKTAACTDANCKHCSDSECYTCKPTHYLEDGVCKDTAGNSVYFLSPGFTVSKGTKTPSDIDLAPVALTTNFSISFFMKFFARRVSNNEVDVLRLGTNLKLRLKYNSSDSTAKLQLYSDKTSTCVIADYGNFIPKFGVWTHIALSFYYDSAKLNYYPANLNFQVDFTPVKTTYSCYNKDHAGLRPNMIIQFPKEVIALYGSVLVWDKYFTGVWGYQTFKGNDKAPKASSLVNSCITAAGKTVYCYRDYTSLLKVADYCATDARFYTGSTCLAKQDKCPYGYFTNSATSDYCSCENKEKKTWIVNKTDTRHHCQKHDYVDILRHMPITINVAASATSEYTLEFWIYMDTYVPSNFHGMDIEWNNHLRIKLGYSNGKYTSTCNPIFISGNSAAINSNSDTITFNPTQTNWGYIRCSVEITKKLYFHFDEPLVTTEKELSGNPVNIAAGATTLKFKGTSDDGILANSGVAFIRQFRLWKCYLCQDADTYRLDITNTTAALYEHLMNLYEAPYHDTPKINNIKVDPATTTALTQNANWIGYNSLNASTYKRLDKVSTNNGNAWLCNEWRDVCSGLVKLNQIENITWTKIDPPMNNRYAIDLWFMNTSTQNLTSGIHFIWRNIGSVSFARDNTTASTLKSYCWPQDYRLNLQDISGNTGYQTINGLPTSTSVINYDSLTTANSDKVWVWIRCSVNWTNRFFYMSANNQKTLEAETVYGDVKNDAPFRYMFQNDEKSTFYIWNGKNNPNTDINCRSINLYTEYIPPNYDVKHADISKVDKSKMPHLTATFNFGAYLKNINKMGHFIGSTWEYTNFKRYNNIVLNYYPITQVPVTTQCNVVLNGKYDSGTGLCALITSCVKNTLNARFCKDEAKAIVCADNYHWDAISSATSGKCENTCGNDISNKKYYVRAPGSSTVSSLCNIICDPNYQTCHNLSSSQLLDLFKNYTCNSAYDRVAYNCIKKTKSEKTYIYMNGCLNFPNITMTFPSGMGSIFGRGYTLEFWFKIDRKNEFCTVTHPNKKYYFIGDPHIIYYEADSTTTTKSDEGNLTYSLYYELSSWNSINPPTKIKLTGISQYNWNHISIHADLLKRDFQVVTNYNNYNPAVKFTNVPTFVDLTFKKIMFCSNNCTPKNSQISNINWGAAWYKSITVADGINYNQWTAKDYSSGILTNELNTQHYDYPLTTNQSLYNSLANLQGTKKPFNFYSYYNSGSLFNFEKTFYFNYGSTFDYPETHPGEFISSQSMTSTSFNAGGCRANCKRCVDVQKNSCTECVAEAKLFAGNCYRKNGNFLKMPLLNYSDKFLSLNVENMVDNFYFEKEEIYTVTIWIKYHGQLITNKDPCVKIFRFMRDGSKYVCYNPTTLKLYFYNDGKVMYEDSTFVYSIGQWSLISLATFMNNVPTIPNLDNYFDYRYNFFVNQHQLVKKPDVKISPPGWKMDTIDIGYGFSAIITDIKIYRNFITNPWGYVTGPKNGIAIEFRIPINGKKNGKCLVDDEIVTDDYKSLRTDPNKSYTDVLGVQCVKDFNPYATATCSTGKYWDNRRFGESITPCSDCNSSCDFNCANSEPNGLGCTCDWESADHALRIDKDTTKTKCELLPYTEFSKLDEFSVGGLKSAKSGEYTMEFWYYLYTYSNTTSPFESEEIIWDNHNKIELLNKNGTMFAGCTPVYKNSNPSAYSEVKTESIPNGLFNWVYVTCSVNTNKGIFYGLRGSQNGIETNKKLFPDYKSLGNSQLIIRPGKKTPANYGMLFIKDIKLWSIYNIKRFETKCYRPVGVLFHEQLLHYFRNDRYTNSIRDEITEITGGGTKRKDFFGYNVLNLKTRQEMIQAPFGICSVINVFPTTGIINVTKFTVQSKENEQLATNRYRFYYYIKGVSVSPISIGVQYGNPDVNVIFEYKDIPKTVKSVEIELYIEIFPQSGAKSYTLFKQLTLFREENEATKLNYNTILQTLKLTSNMNEDMILDAQKSINRLETDLPKGLNSTFSKPKAIRGQNSIKLAKASCTDSSLCNGRGYCYNVEIMSYCTCFNGYTGRYCQISKTNYQTLKKYQTELTTIVSYNLANNTNFDNKNAITNKDIQAIKLGFNTDLQNFDKLSDMNSYIDTMDILVKNSNKGNMGNVLTENRNEMIDISSKMLGYLQTSQYKTKYDNLKQKIIASGNYTDPDGKYTVRFLPDPTAITQSQIGVNSNLTLKNNTNNRRKRNTRDFRRNLQTTNNTNFIDFVITVNDPSILTLTPEQNQQYKESYQKVYSQFDSLTKTFINGSQGNPIKINQVNTMYNYTLDYFYISDLENLDFNTYFANRIANGESYFDAKRCLLDNSNKLKADPYNYFYLAYYFDETPFFDFSQDYLDRAISLNSYITVYNANSTEIKLTCNDDKKIKHYIGLYPQNQNFINKFNLYPEKYQKNDPIYQSKEYMPYFIFPNGTIDHTNSLEVQKDMYYRQYAINITDYKNPIQKDIENFKYIIEFKYIYAEVSRTGNLAAFTYYDALTKMMGNNYYFSYSQIFSCSANYNNPCFILLIVFFAFSIPILILLICLKNMFRKFNSLNEWSEREEKIMEKDSAIFGFNRYSFWMNCGVSSNPINNSKIADNNVVMERNEPDKKDKESEAIVYESENIAVKESENRMQKVNIGSSGENNGEFYGENKGICYSFVYFLIFRNIYSSFILLTSPFNPKYKTFSKFMFLIYTEMLFTSIFFIFAPFDLYGKASVDLDKAKMFLYILYSTLISNFFLVILSYVLKPSNKMVTNAKLSNFDIESLKNIRNSNILKTLLWNLMNLLMAGLCFYVSFGYCSVWRQHASTVIVLWILTFIFDFILMELCLELFIMIFFICRKVTPFRLIMKFYVAIKSLRNYH